MRAAVRLGRQDDERLAALVGQGDAAAFETLYDRHHAALLAFCRHMLGNREDGEDALQQAFLRAHRALAEGRAPDTVGPWLFAIARNRCLTMLATRRDAAVPAEGVEPSFDGLAEDVERRAELRELVTDLSRLPGDQRGALVLAELGDFSHPEIAQVIGCSPAKVKALVFQARTTLVADRDARRTPCDEIRTLLETARGGVLRRGALRRHLRQCDPCAAYRLATEGHRSGLALVLPVAPTVGLKAAVLAGAGGLGGGTEGAAAATALVASGSLAAASGGGVAGGAAAAGGVAVKGLAAKAAVAVALGAGAAGGGTAVQDLVREDPVPVAKTQPAAQRAPAERPEQRAPAERPERRAPREDQPPQRLSDAAPAALVVPTVQTRDRRRVRPVVAQRLRATDPLAIQRARRRVRRHRVRVGAATPRMRPRSHPRSAVVIGSARPERHRRRRQPDPAPVPAPTATSAPAPAAAPDPAPTPEPRSRRRRRPVVTSTPVPPVESTATPAPPPAPTATP